MRLILRETVESLGTVGDEVTVANGYARNYLLPQKKAVLATSANRKQIERERKGLELQALRDQSQAEAMAKALEGVVCTIAAKVSEEEKLYGSVTSRDIADQLQAQGITVDRRTIQLSEPIKRLGSYIVPLRLHPHVSAEISVRVITEE